MAHIWLIGMMGTGKTTVGALVAERLHMPLVDTDAMIMEATGRTIPDLFAASEEDFRLAERRVVEAVAQGAPAVVSTGGGVVMDDESVTLMARSGTVVLLTADAESITGRLGTGSSRPLFTGKESIEDLMRHRARQYGDAADHTVDTAHRTPDEVAEEVIRCVNT